MSSTHRFCGLVAPIQGITLTSADGAPKSLNGIVGYDPRPRPFERARKIAKLIEFHIDTASARFSMLSSSELEAWLSGAARMGIIDLYNKHCIDPWLKSLPEDGIAALNALHVNTNDHEYFQRPIIKNYIVAKTEYFVHKY